MEAKTNKPGGPERRTQGLEADQLGGPVGTTTLRSSDTRQLRLTIIPDGNGRWRAYLAGELISHASSPFIHSARILLSRGHHELAVLELWHRGAEHWALRGRLGEVAAHRMEGERKAPESTRNTALVRPLFGAATPLARRAK
jgi:hypothetical protein